MKFYFNFVFGNRNKKKLLSAIRNKKKKHGRILVMAKSKLNSIENLILQALNDMGVSHEEFVTLLKEKGKYDKMKESFKSAVKDEKEKNVRLNNMHNHV